MAEKWHVGNANTDGESTRGWLLGHFIGEGREGWATTPSRVQGLTIPGRPRRTPS